MKLGKSVVFILFYMLATGAVAQSTSSRAAAIDSAVCAVDVKQSLSLITTVKGPQPENVDYPLQVWQAHVDFAERIWTLFEETHELDANFDPCLVPPLNARSMNQALTKVFFEGSLQKIQQMNPNFFQRLDQRKKLEQIAFSAFAKCEACQTDYKLLKSGRPAQFNHASESITAMISKMSLSDWVIIFIHEVGHHFYQDEKWNRPFLDQKIIQRLESLVATKTNVAQLTPEETQLIDQWLWNGVHTKLISEWKVWSLTLLYVENQPASIFGKNTAWLKYFHQLPVAIKYKELFKSLEANFTDPKEGLESKPIILERIQVLRQKLRQQVESGELQPLDFLGE